ncbi:hypothetical protein APSETT444_001721 [Aspergillus pseudonomiae]
MDENKHKVSEVCGNSPSQVIDRLLTFSPVSIARLGLYGKPLHDGLGDVQEAYDITNYFAGLVEIADGEASLNSPDSLNISMRQPFGVVASITPWNFPTMIVYIGKGPSECKSPSVEFLDKLSGLTADGSQEVLLAQLAYQAGFPPGILNVVSGPGQTGALLSAHMRTRLVHGFELDARASSTHMGPQADSKQAAAVARYLEAGLQDGQALVGGKRALDAG